MPINLLASAGSHRNVLLPEFGEGAAVQANQHLIVDGDEGILLDPGGHKVYSKVLAETMSQLGRGRLKYLLFSHQDPDIIAAANGWLMTTTATAYIPSLWTRFVPHFGLDRLVMDRLIGVPDDGIELTLGTSQLRAIPAHFLHSPGNLQLWDPTTRVLYSGDLGASLGQPYVEVTDFDAHVPYMEGFHRRYMAGNAVMRRWAAQVRELPIEVIAPQHGAMFKGRDLVERFIDWCENLQCGLDLLGTWYATGR